MNAIINLLKDQYNLTINQKSDWGFFYSLADYMNYIIENPTLNKIVNSVMNKKQEEYDKLAELEEKSLKELKKSKDKLLKIIKDNNAGAATVSPRRTSHL